MDLPLFYLFSCDMFLWPLYDTDRVPGASLSIVCLIFGIRKTTRLHETSETQLTAQQ